MWQKIIISTWLLFLISSRSEGQVLTYQFIDPCTKQVTFFSIPTSGTTIFFLGQSRQFTSSDVSNGIFSMWINQVYSEYRKVTPCSQQSGQVTQNQIISQSISGTVQGVVGSILSQTQSSSQSSSIKSTSVLETGSKKGGVISNIKTKSKDIKNKSNVSGNNKTDVGTTGGNSSNTNSGDNNGTGSNTTTGTNTTQDNKQNTEEVAATTIMNNDATQDKEGNSSKEKSARSNPLIFQSDLTTAQNLDRTFTPILNLGISRSSMTGASSFSLTSMTWLNFKQFALSARYTKIHYSNGGSLKYIHNISLTGVYTYGNVLSFIGYSGILNAGRWGITGFNLSAAGSIVSEESNTYLSPSFTAFYTRPIKSGNRMTISPEIYIISTPLIYSSNDRITVTDRTFSGFLGSGFDYQITKRFKLNANYKANISTNTNFPILSFLLIGSKINL